MVVWGYCQGWGAAIRQLPARSFNRIPATYEVAERSEGFIDRSHLDPDTGRHSWGELVCPRFLPDELHPNVARTLTLWRSLESVFAFSYADLHGEALTLRAQWFRK